MVKILQESDIDPITEEIDLVMTREEEDAANQRFARTDSASDLSDGGMVGGAKLRPMQADGRLAPKGQQARGRAAARLAWMWDGTESVLPLAWNPNGTSHDGARRYLRKRHCLCCGHGGFIGAQCPNCVKSQCNNCSASSVKANIIPNFYLRQQDVPFPRKFYGSIDCFNPACIRHGNRGFKTQEEMRMHARSRHGREYQAHQETLAAERTDELATLRQRIDALTNASITRAERVQPASEKTERTEKQKKRKK